MFIRRLAAGTTRKWRWFCDFFLFTLALYLISATIWFLLTCDPLRAQWDLLYRGRLEETPSCIDGRRWGQTYNVAHAVQGVMLLISPIVILWKVRIEVKKKIRLFFIWGCGLLAVLCGLMRMLDANFTSDVFWSYTQLLIWTSLDVTVGIVVISLPVLDAMIAAKLSKAISKTRKTNTGGWSGYGYLDKSKTRWGPPSMAKSANTIEPKEELGNEQGDALPQANQKLSNSNHPVVELSIMRTVEYAVRYLSVEKAPAGGLAKQGRKR